MGKLQEVAKNRIMLTIATAIATAIGTHLATAFPAVWSAMCLS